MKRVISLAIATGAVLTVASTVLAQDRPAPAAQTFKGLEIAVVSLTRVSSAALGDCPPGTNSQRAMSRPGEGFAVVTLKLKVLPDFKPFVPKKPVVTDRAGKTYNTAASFVDVGKTPEYTCGFPFRLPEGTKLKSIQVDGVTFDLTPLDPPQP